MNILLLSMPYVLALGLQIDGDPLSLKSRLACGVMLAAALSIKPQYALMVLFVLFSIAAYILAG